MYKMKSFVPVIVLSLVMLAGTLYCAWATFAQPFSWVSFWEQERELKPYYDGEEDIYYLFLPSHVTAQTVQFQREPWAQVQITSGGRDYDSVFDVPVGDMMEIHASVMGFGWRERLRVYRNETLPTLYLQSEPYLLENLHKDRESKWEVFAEMIDQNGNALFSQTASISGRGNGTWLGEPLGDGNWAGQPKRPYNLTLSDPVSVGNIKESSRLCLLAEYADNSKMRNALSYFAGRELEIPFASGYAYTNVYVNGEYLGLYGISSKEEYRKAIPQGQILGAFEITSWMNVDFSTKLDDVMIRILYGSKDTIRTRLNALESALADQDWQRCRELIDVTSFARKYALEEFLANTDLSYASQYFYIGQDDKIHCMLPWDYDWSLGASISYYNDRQTYELKAYRQDCWYSALLEWDAFREEVGNVLEEDFTPDFLSELEGFLAATASQIAPSWNHDRIRWKSSPPFNTDYVDVQVEGPGGYAAMFNQYFPQRRQFLMDYFRNWEDYCVVRFVGYNDGNLCVPRGADLGPYVEQAAMVGQPGQGPDHWETESGQRLETVETVEEDMVFYAGYSE